jgi:hypothetical protein
MDIGCGFLIRAERSFVPFLRAPTSRDEAAPAAMVRGHHDYAVTTGHPADTALPTTLERAA